MVRTALARLGRIASVPTLRLICPCEPNRNRAGRRARLERSIVKPALFAFYCRVALLCGACAISGCSGHRGTVREIRAPGRTADIVEALNALSNDINVRYGYR